MKLSIKDRILLSQILPKKGKLIELRLSQLITDKVAFNSIEISEFELKDIEGGAVTWNPKKSIAVDFQFTLNEIELLKHQITELDKNGEITLDLLSLCDKILRE
jgi:hypothetical protein